MKPIEEWTKRDRIEFWKNIYKRVERAACIFICSNICLQLDRTRDIQLTIQEINERFPEFYKYKPKVLYHPNLWYPITDIQSRLNLINQIIKDLENDNSN